MLHSVNNIDVTMTFFLKYGFEIKHKPEQFADKRFSLIASNGGAYHAKTFDT
nr:hypothetical protein [Vibrio sp. 04Ya108]